MGANFSTIGLCCITISWQQIFEDALQVTVVGVLLHETVERITGTTPSDFSLDLVIFGFT